jgi:hypothetical protein
MAVPIKLFDGTNGIQKFRQVPWQHQRLEPAGEDGLEPRKLPYRCEERQQEQYS